MGVAAAVVVGITPRAAVDLVLLVVHVFEVLHSGGAQDAGHVLAGDIALVLPVYQPKRLVRRVYTIALNSTEM